MPFAPATSRVLVLLVFVCRVMSSQAPVGASAKAPARFNWVQMRLIDGDLGTGLPDVEVQIKGYSLVNRRSPFEMWIKTGVDGTRKFPLMPGSYTAKIMTPGYVPAWGTASTVNIDVPTEPTDIINIKALFYRPAALSGRVTDYDSGQPLRDIHVTAVHCDFLRGIRRFVPALAATTDKDGNFNIADLAPGDYIVELVGTGPERVITSKAAPPQSGYGKSFWPGTAENPSPFHLQSGARHDVGLVQLHTTELRTLDIALKSGSCIPGLPYTATLLFNAARIKDGEFVFFCEDALQLGWITPGMYDVLVVQRADVPSADASDVRTSGFESVDLVRKNGKVELAVADPLTIKGEVKIEEQDSHSDPDPIPRFTIRLSAAEDSNAMTLPHFDSLVSEDGSFSGRVMTGPSKKVRVMPMGLPNDLAVKQLTYNLISSSLPQVFELNTSTGQHEIGLLLSRQISHVIGQVAGDSATDFNDVRVLAVPWPSETENDYPVVIHEVTPNKEGKFEFSSLLAGCYKMIAVTREDREKLEEPGKMLQMMAGLDSVNLPVGNFTAPAVKVVAF